MLYSRDKNCRKCKFIIFTIHTENMLFISIRCYKIGLPFFYQNSNLNVFLINKTKFFLFSATDPRSKFTREQINNMIEGMNLGRYYNIDGNDASGNETRLTLEDLNRYLRNLDSTGNSHSHD